MASCLGSNLSVAEFASRVPAAGSTAPGSGSRRYRASAGPPDKKVGPSSLQAHGYHLWGWCGDCAKLYRMDVPAEYPVKALVAERGADSCVRMAPVPRFMSGHRVTGGFWQCSASR